MMFAGTFVSIFCMLTLFGTVSGAYTYRRSDQMCDDFIKNIEYFSTGVAFLGVFTILAILLMV
jgi:hypothetical protein